MVSGGSRLTWGRRQIVDCLGFYCLFTVETGSLDEVTIGIDFFTRLRIGRLVNEKL